MTNKSQTNEFDPTIANEPEVPEEMHPDQVAQDMIRYAAQNGFGVSASGFTLTRAVGALKADYTYSGGG